MRLQEKFSFDDSGVSPVVGVILMVAITVILAAVIGTFVLDLGGQVQQNAQAGVMFDENEGTNVTVQLNSVQNADQIYVESSAESSYNGTLMDSSGSPGVGGSVTVSGNAYNPGDTVTVIGFLEGSSNVIQTYEMGG